MKTLTIIAALLCWVRLQAQVIFESKTELEKRGSSVKQLMDERAAIQPASPKGTKSSFQDAATLMGMTGDRTRDFMREVTDMSMRMFETYPRRGSIQLQVFNLPQRLHIIYEIKNPAGALVNSKDVQLAVDSLAAYFSTMNSKSYTGLSFLNFQLGHRDTKPKPNTIYELADITNTQRPDTVKVAILEHLRLEAVPEVLYSLTNLERLDLNFNRLKELKIDLSRWANIKKFDAVNAQIESMNLGQNTTNIEEINLANNKLSQIDWNMSLFPKLKTLTLSDNKLTNESIKFSKNTTLKVLLLQTNRLTDVPVSVKANRGMTSLWLGGNTLSALNNQSFAGMKQLKDLNLYRCSINTLPQGIGKLKNLEILDVYYNQLTTLPKQIRRMKQLQQLAIANNNIATLPKNWGRKPNLHTIYAHHNHLTELPEAWKKLVSLRLLDINHNWLSALPGVLSKLESLEELDISHNNINQIAGELTALVTLQKLYVRGNPFFEDQALAAKSETAIKNLEANKVEIK